MTDEAEPRHGETPAVHDVTELREGPETGPMEVDEDGEHLLEAAAEGDRVRRPGTDPTGAVLDPEAAGAATSPDVNQGDNAAEWSHER